MYKTNKAKNQIVGLSANPMTLSVLVTS